MYKLNLGVGFSIFKLVYLPYNDKTFILEIIKQHKLILSDKIINYYLEMAGEENSDIVESFLDALIYNDESHVYYKTNSEISAKDELIRLVEQNPMRVLVAEDEEFKDFTINKIKLISSKDIVEKKVNSLFRYSFPIVNYYVDVGEKCESYARWFGHLFGKYQMSIGAGLDFLHISGTTKKACIINITYGEKKIPLPCVDHLLL